jgi:ATP-dependent protease ClpP protease subunit
MPAIKTAQFASVGTGSMVKSFKTHTFPVIFPDVSTAFSIFGHINLNTLNDLWSYLSKLKDKEVTIFIHSSGGDANVALAIINMLKGYKVTTVGLNNVQSAALSIFLIGERRLAYDNTIFMAHEVYSNSVIANFLKVGYYEITRKHMDDLYNVNGLTLPKRKFFNLVDQQQFYTAKEAIEKGFVTEIIR